MSETNKTAASKWGSILLSSRSSAVGILYDLTLPPSLFSNQHLDKDRFLLPSTTPTSQSCEALTRRKAPSPGVISQGGGRGKKTAGSETGQGSSSPCNRPLVGGRDLSVPPVAGRDTLVTLMIYRCWDRENTPQLSLACLVRRGARRRRGGQTTKSVQLSLSSNLSARPKCVIGGPTSSCWKWKGGVSHTTPPNPRMRLR